MTDGGTRFGACTLAGLGMLLLAACGTTAGAPAAPAAVSAAAQAPADLERRIGALPPQELDPGQCGLFLWGRTVPAKLVLFGTGLEEGTARVMLDGREASLVRAAAEGDPVFGQFPRQSFKGSGAEVLLTLTFERRPDLVGGALVPRGLLELRDMAGWSHVMPVAGMIGCQPG